MLWFLRASVMLDSMTPIIGISYAACKLLRATDEAETQFYRCVKCNHTWREYA